MGEHGVKHITVPGLRLHLRRHPDHNMLWINSQKVLMLNTTAADYVEAYIDAMRSTSQFDQSVVKSKITKAIEEKYPTVTKERILSDFDTLYAQIVAISENKCPVYDLGIGQQVIDVNRLTAPPRVDLALTYRCNNKCSYCYTGGSRKTKELDTTDWTQILGKLWKAGVPQVVFTGGEPTLRDDLVLLVSRAEEFVTGLVTNGRLLHKLSRSLNEASLDYVQVSIESNSQSVHDEMTGVPGSWAETVNGIGVAVKEGLNVYTNTTLTKRNADHFTSTMEFLASMGVKGIACNSLICSGLGCKAIEKDGLSEETLKGILQNACEKARELKMEFNWYTPTCYKKLNPVDLGLGVKSCSAAQYNVTIEPDGTVIPCQSLFTHKMGHIMKDSWEKIWGNKSAKKIRNHYFISDECKSCDFLETCGGSCPLATGELK
jgi:radical SAM protein with 4Fe4S-binding SPASM domain